MSPADRVRIEHMLEAARNAVSFAKGRSSGDLSTDDMLLFSVERAIEIMGEAAGKVSNELRSAHPEIPWPDVIGMRNRLIHAYFDINVSIVWATVAGGLPTLISHLEELLREADDF